MILIQVLMPVARSFNPDIVLVSAGFDAAGHTLLLSNIYLFCSFQVAEL
jgi:acetoin utilization deacetylase AcuC-like enzyme